jgi:phage gp37-like protein
VRAPRVVVACPTSNDLAASDAEVSEIAFEIASADYVNVKSTSDNWQDKLFAVLGRRAVESAIRIYMETTQKNEKEQRKHLLYERLIRQQTDYGLGTLNLAFIQNTMNSDNVVDNVLMGGSVEADSGKVTDTYSFTQLVEYYNLSKKFGTRGIEQLLLFRDNLTSFEPKALTSEFLESLKFVLPLHANKK